MTTTESPAEPQNGAEEDLQEEHLPEWVEIFGELQREAEEAYPDGRVRILVPKRKKRR